MQTHADPVFDKTSAALAVEMIATMHAAHGIGLAAQQVGRAVQLCVVDLRDAEAKFNWNLDGASPPLELFMPLTIANPAIAFSHGVAADVAEEGCLSFPEIRGNITRPSTISVKFKDERGVAHTLASDGLFARCIQHEADHLNGVLFIDRMEKKIRASLDDAIKALAKETKAAGKTNSHPIPKT